MLVWPCLVKASPEMIEIGTVDNRSGRAMREPVIMIAWLGSASPPSSAGASCAMAGAANAQSANAAAEILSECPHRPILDMVEVNFLLSPCCLGIAEV